MQVPGDIGSLHRNDRTGEQHQSHRAEQRQKHRRLIVVRNQGRSCKEQPVDRHGDRKAYPEDRTEIALLHLLRLNQRRRKTRLHEYIRKRDEDHNQAYGPVLGRGHEPREKQCNDKLNALRAEQL